jgi:hypothetical protein
MSRLKLYPLLALSVAAALALSACGGDDDDGGDDADQISEVIETAATSTDPADCTELQTQAFTEQTELETGEAAIASCEESAADETDNPESIEVSEVEVDGEAATANAAFTGGPFDGSTLALGLVKEGDQWKVDEITDIPEFDFEGFKAAFTEEIGADESIPPEVGTCISDALDAAGPDAVKEAFLSGDEQQLVGVFGQCIGAGA